MNCGKPNDVKDAIMREREEAEDVPDSLIQ